jgi:hypothetical protein
MTMRVIVVMMVRRHVHNLHGFYGHGFHSLPGSISRRNGQG